ncbi:MAG: hypothetical protein U0795_04865 [Pirellulales bacterium]
MADGSAAAAQPIPGEADATRPDAWLVPEARVSDAVAQIDRCPLMIVRRSALVGEPARAEVDRLQAAVAPAGDFAGFLALPDSLAAPWESA